MSSLLRRYCWQAMACLVMPPIYTLAEKLCTAVFTVVPSVGIWVCSTFLENKQVNGIFQMADNALINCSNSTCGESLAKVTHEMIFLKKIGV